MYIGLWIDYKITITKLELNSKQFNMCMYVYIYINHELEHHEIEYMNMQFMKLYEYMWIKNYTWSTYKYEYIYMNSFMHIQCI